jgi:hypothetical protein
VASRSLPHLTLRANARLGAAVGLVEAGDGRERALQHTHYLAQPEVGGLADQRMPSLRTADAPDEAGATQGGQKLVQVRLRDALSSGDLGALKRALPKVVGQLDEGAHSVVTLGGHTHR